MSFVLTRQLGRRIAVLGANETGHSCSICALSLLVSWRALFLSAECIADGIYPMPSFRVVRVVRWAATVDTSVMEPVLCAA